VGIRLYDRDKHRHHRHIYGGHDPGVCACGTGANAAWLCGYAGEAVDLADQAIAIGAEIEHPFSQVIAYMWATLACHGTRNYTLARERAEALLQLCERFGFPAWRGLAMVVSGACRTLAGETEFGLKLIAEGLVAQRQFGMGSWLGAVLATSAEAHIRAGNLGRALELLAEAIAHAEKSHAKVLLPEVQRLHAEVQLLSVQIDTPLALARVEAAAALAREQGALALEWRATMVLSRLHAGVGRDAEARTMLRDNYAAFTQGFASPDLIEGKQLLDSLS